MVEYLVRWEGGGRLRVYLSVDMEGATGVVLREEVQPGARLYEQGLELLTGDVNAAIQGALDAGAEDIVVNDAHWAMSNLSARSVLAPARLIRGAHKPLGMMEGIQGRPDASIFIGYHGMAGQSGVLSHTMLGREVHRLQINGRDVGETAINAATAGEFGVPVVMVAGDDLACREAKQILPSIMVVATKRSIGRFNAECLPAEESWARIREGAREALSSSPPKPLVFDKPYRLEVEFAAPTMADVAGLVPRAVRKSERWVSYESENYIELVRLLRALMLLARTVRDESY